MDIEMPLNEMTHNEMTLNKITFDVSINKINANKLNANKIKKPNFKNIMAELLKPPPKEEKPNVHLSGGGQFSKLEKI